MSDGEVWHQLHAQREDGASAMFLIRDIVPRLDQHTIFVIEMPYPITELSKLPDVAGFRRLHTFQEQWLVPACTALDWTFVAWKSEVGSFFLYVYGSGDPQLLLERLAPFDGALGFFEDHDPQWDEYAALRELLDQAAEDDHVHEPPADDRTSPAIPLPKPVKKPAKQTKKPAKKKPAKKKPAKKPAAKKPAKKKPAKKKRVSR